MDIEVIVLGCGSSSGTPAIGCGCPTCTSPHPKDRRTRASSVVRVNGLNLLIDTSPDLRQQALREGITQIDAVLYTHPHADHLNGIDDLRAFCYAKRGVIPLFGNALMMENIRSRFGYTLLPPGTHWDKPVLEAHTVAGACSLGGVGVQPIPVSHGNWEILGWRIGKVAYLTDVSAISEASYALLAGVELLLLDCLRMTPYPSHLGFYQSLEVAQRVGAAETVLIHMTHELAYQTLSELCPHGVRVGWDGLRVRVA